MELKVDCFRCENTSLLGSPKLLEQLMLDVARRGKMTVFSGPHIVECPFPSPDGGLALSGVLFLGESSITIHTYPEFKSVFIDVFHCLPFDVNLIFWLLVYRFEMDTAYIDTYCFERGLREGAPVRTRMLNSWGVGPKETMREMKEMKEMKELEIQGVRR